MSGAGSGGGRHYDFDLQLRLLPGGWSRAWIWLSGEAGPRVFELTHAGENPWREMARAAAEIAAGADRASFVWCGEPGRDELRLTVVPERRNRLVLSCWDDEACAWTAEVATSHWLALVYAELLKVALLLEQKHFRAERDVDFPADELIRLRVSLAARRAVT